MASLAKDALSRIQRGDADAAVLYIWDIATAQHESNSMMTRFVLVSRYTCPMVTAFAEEAARIRETAHLSDRDIARATGAGVSTVGAWLRGARSPRGEHAERLAELSTIVERLARVMEPGYIPVWLHKPLTALDDEKPIDLLACGEWRRLARLVSELESPTFS
jgi:transcriptional regulator with XRE-family HTH domain